MTDVPGRILSKNLSKVQPLTKPGQNAGMEDRKLSQGSHLEITAAAAAESSLLPGTCPVCFDLSRCWFGNRLQPASSRSWICVDGSDNRLGKFLFQIIEATRGGMPARDGNRSPRDDRSWGSRAKDFVICAEAALRGKKGDPYPLNNSSLGRWVG